MCQIIVRTYKVQGIIHFRQPTNPLIETWAYESSRKPCAKVTPHSIRFPASETSRARLLCFASLAVRGSVVHFACSLSFSSDPD